MIDQVTLNQAWIIVEKIKDVPLYTVIKVPYEDRSDKWNAQFVFTFGDKVGDSYKWKFLRVEPSTI